MGRFRSFWVMALLVPAGLASAQNAGTAGTGKGTAPAISAADVLTRITFLASDELKGRDTPSPGLEKAAQYIAQEFKSFGLLPGGDSGTFIQRWPYNRKQFSASGARATLGSKPLTYLQDFFIIPGPRDSVSGPVMFIGSAGGQPAQIPASAREQILAFYVPGKAADDAWLNSVRTILQPAFALQPRAVLLVLDPEFPTEQIGFVATNAGSESLPATMVGLKYDAAKAWFAQAGADLDALRARTTPDNEARSALNITLVTKQEESGSRPPNVVGILPGSDPVLKDTYVVFSAHMDHVGVGQPNASGDSIFNGADDDASGTSAVLEVAQAFAALPADQRPKRSIIFLLVSGEEKGLFGSRYFVENPPVPADRMIANINIDMIGRNNPDTVVAIGQDYSTLGATVQQVAKAHADLKLTVAPDLWPQEQLFFRSDHFNFALAKIPAIFFTTGLHADYHQPSDEVQTINTEKVARIAQLTFRLAQAVAVASDTPKWTDAGTAAMKAISGNE